MCISVFLYFVLPLIQFIKMKIERNLTEFFCFSFFSVYGCDELPVFLFCFPFTAKIKFVSGGKFLVDTFTRLKSRFCE